MVRKSKYSRIIAIAGVFLLCSCVTTKNVHREVVPAKGNPNQGPGGATADQSKSAGTTSGVDLTNSNVVKTAPDLQIVAADTTHEQPSRPVGVSTSIRIGLIFSGGGAKAWAHVGFLKELEQYKWPIVAVGGQEWGAVVAALYANKLSANEVEWELSKIKSFDGLDEISGAIFNNKSVSDLKIPFVCPSLNVSKQSLYLLNRGQLNKLIPFCVAHEPIYKPYQQSIADLVDFAGIAQHLRATGANRIILINVLAQNVRRSLTADYLSAENVLWVQSAALMGKKINGIDEIINIDLDDYSITNLDKKREIIAKGAELGYKVLKATSKKLGL
jgi:NTE family protein